MINTKYQQLAGLFNDQERPTITSLETSHDSALIALHVPADLSWFEGHFPDQKVLPGVVQIDWVGKFGRVLFTDSAEFKQLTNIKFKTMIMPDTEVTLELTYAPEKGNLKFHFFNENESFSLGSLKFNPS